MQKQLLTAITVLGLTSFGTLNAQAASFLNPTPTANSDIGNVVTNFGSLANTSNGSGLSGGGLPVDEQTHGAGSVGHWSAGLQNGATIGDVNLDFDFGSSELLSSLILWNYNAFNPTATQRGIQDFTLILSNNADFSDPVYTSGILTLAQGPGNTSIPGTTFDIPNISAQYARIDIISNYGPSTLVGLSEVRFETVPEPLTLLGAGAAIAFGTSFKRKLGKAKKK